MVIQARKPSAKASKAHKPANGSTKSKMLRSKSVLKAPPPKQQKTKSAAPPPKKKRPVYTAEELGVPALNMITPVGAVKPRGKKKGKVFVDDGESMMTILAMVNADKEGQIESKMIKARQLEEIRQARLKEQEARQEAKKSKLDEAKNSLRKKRKHKDHNAVDAPSENVTQVERKSAQTGKKRVRFG